MIKRVLLTVLILGILVERISNEEILTKLNEALNRIPLPKKDSNDLAVSFVSFDSMMIDRVEKGKPLPLKINNSFEQTFKNAKFSVGTYTAFHLLNFIAIDEAENYLVIGTIDKNAPKYVKFVLIQTKVRILPKDYQIYKNVLDSINKKKSHCKGCSNYLSESDPDYKFLKSHGLTLDTLTTKVQQLYSSYRENLRQSIENILSHCSRECSNLYKCERVHFKLRCKKNYKQKTQECINKCHQKRQNNYHNLKYKMSLEVKQLLKKKFENAAFRTQVLNYFNKGIFQTENIFKIIKTEIQKLQTKSPQNIYNYVLNTDVSTNYVSDVTRKGDYSKYNLNNQIKSQLEMFKFTSQVDLKAFNFEAQLSTGEYEQIIGVGIVDPNDQNLVHLTFFQARARSKLRQQYKYPYPGCTKKYYTTNLDRVIYPKRPFPYYLYYHHLNPSYSRFNPPYIHRPPPLYYQKLMEDYNKFLKDYPKECFNEERGLLPSEISLIKTEMKSHAYKALKNKIERVYVK